jgi:GNAT superfamily N-acetyltransferase
MPAPLVVRPVRHEDEEPWRILWSGYNAFYGREGASTLPEDITAAAWRRFFDPAEPMRALVAEDGGRLVGLVHAVFHRSTTRLNDVCYLQDLFTVPECRGRGVGRQLIRAVYDLAAQSGSSRVYWQTMDTNAAGRALYDHVAQHKGFIVYAHEL